jgi:hypothetical protein
MSMETIFQKALQLTSDMETASLFVTLFYYKIKEKKKNYYTKLELAWRLITLKLLEIIKTTNAQTLFYQDIF